MECADSWLCCGAQLKPHHICWCYNRRRPHQQQWQVSIQGGCGPACRLVQKQQSFLTNKQNNVLSEVGIIKQNMKPLNLQDHLSSQGSLEKIQRYQSLCVITTRLQQVWCNRLSSNSQQNWPVPTFDWTGWGPPGPRWNWQVLSQLLTELAEAHPNSQPNWQRPILPPSGTERRPPRLSTELTEACPDSQRNWPSLPRLLPKLRPATTLYRTDRGLSQH